jgi:mono/diheme cytochrome c family protein
MQSINNGQLTMNNYHYLLLLLIFSFGCSPKTENKKETSTKFQQYYIQGEQLYLQHCSNCHQKNGKGLGLVYPPLDTSDFMTNSFSEVICLIKNGKSGELIVNGKNYNQKMSGLPDLSNLEIAEISTYIYNTWTHNHGLVDVKDVSTLLSTCITE